MEEENKKTLAQGSAPPPVEGENATEPPTPPTEDENATKPPIPPTEGENAIEPPTPPTEGENAIEPPTPPRKKTPPKESKETLESWAKKHNTSCEVLVGIENLRDWSLTSLITEQQYLSALEAWKHHEAGNAEETS